jgi:RNA polymerase sigma factor (sigma-70 family)
MLGMTVISGNGKVKVVVREDDNSDWKTLVTWEIEDKSFSRCLPFSKDDKYIYLIDFRNTNTSRVVKMEIATGSSEIIAYDREYDIWDDEGFLLSPYGSDIQAISFYKARKEWIVLDETIKEDFEAIKKIDYGDFFITSRDEADENWIIGFNKDNGPVSYYTFNRKLKKATFLFYNHPSLNDYTLSPMEELSFTSRDGLNIHGYITYPSVQDRSNLPVILYVHGGPWWRDTWGYNPTVQWFANRGYACLQVNYRGSVGYGKDFLNAGNKEWGGKMQDDLVDAVNWVIEKGIADPGRVAIYGVGYGGYAALAGITFTPDLFHCAVAINCPGNLISLIQSIPSYWKNYRNTFLRMIGDPDKEKDFLISRSPFFKTEQIKSPLLIVHGLNDQRVKSDESCQIVKVMKSKGIDVEYVVFKDEGHTISKPENRIKFYVIVEKFLARYLRGRYEYRKIYSQEKYITIAGEKDLKERKLIDKILNEGDKQSFEKLVEYYKKTLLKYLIYKTGDIELSMELLQKIFLNVWLYLHSYHYDADFSSWLLSIASNEVKKHYLINKHMKNEINFDEINSDIIIYEWEKNLDNKIVIQAMIDSLKEPYKTAMKLRFMEELDYKEIAFIMNKKPEDIKNYLFRAKKYLMNAWTNKINIHRTKYSEKID